MFGLGRGRVERLVRTLHWTIVAFLFTDEQLQTTGYAFFECVYTRVFIRDRNWKNEFEQVSPSPASSLQTNINLPSIFPRFERETPDPHSSSLEWVKIRLLRINLLRWNNVPRTSRIFCPKMANVFSVLSIFKCSPGKRVRSLVMVREPVASARWLNNNLPRCRGHVNSFRSCRNCKV